MRAHTLLSTGLLGIVAFTTAFPTSEPCTSTWTAHGTGVSAHPDHKSGSHTRLATGTRMFEHMSAGVDLSGQPDGKPTQAARDLPKSDMSSRSEGKSTGTDHFGHKSTASSKHGRPHHKHTHKPTQVHSVLHSARAAVWSDWSGQSDHKPTHATMNATETGMPHFPDRPGHMSDNTPWPATGSGASAYSSHSSSHSHTESFTFSSVDISRGVPGKASPTGGILTSTVEVAPTQSSDNSTITIETRTTTESVAASSSPLPAASELNTVFSELSTATSILATISRPTTLSTSRVSFAEGIAPAFRNSKPSATDLAARNEACEMNEDRECRRPATGLSTRLKTCEMNEVGECRRPATT